MGEFSEKVFAIVAQIPRGKVSTYGQVARLMGSARSARYVGYALRNNPSPTALAFAVRFHRAHGLDDNTSTAITTLGGSESSPRNEPGDSELLALEQADALIPCHRVVFSDGRLCNNFAFGGPEIQRAMLEEEGVTFADDEHVNLDACLWDGHLTMLADEAIEGKPTAPPPGFDWAAELGE